MRLAGAVAPGDLRAPLVIARSWNVDPVVTTLLALSALAYVWAAARVRQRTGAPLPHHRRAYFLAGVLVVALALVSPIDPYSNLLLSVHMVQHLLLTMVAAPLLLLGAPVTLALQVTSPSTRRRLLLPVLRARVVRLATHPVVGWGAFALVMWSTHFTGLYEASLRSPGLHALEHAAYLAGALLFWRPVVAADPAGGRLSHPSRLLYLFLAMPQTTFLGLAIYSSNRVLYPFYLATGARLGVSALDDQHLAGAIMWASAMLLMLPAVALVLVGWMNREEREGARLDERLATGDARRGATGTP
jgi:putative membrane protein